VLKDILSNYLDEVKNHKFLVMPESDHVNHSETEKASSYLADNVRSLSATADGPLKSSENVDLPASHSQQQRDMSTDTEKAAPGVVTEEISNKHGRKDDMKKATQVPTQVKEKRRSKSANRTLSMLIYDTEEILRRVEKVFCACSNCCVINRS
jgi:predicted exporter